MGPPHTMRLSLARDTSVGVVTVALLALAGCIGDCRASLADFPECIDQAGYISNARPDCSYKLIYCDQENSQFCDERDLCDLSYSCDPRQADPFSTQTAATPTSLASSSPSSHSSPSRPSSPSWTDSTWSSWSSTAAPSDVRRLCRRGVTHKYMYPGNCNYYYYCVDGYLVVEQCPLGYAFDELVGSCSGRIVDMRACRAA